MKAGECRENIRQGCIGLEKKQNEKTDIRERLKKGPVLFDGGMGTYFSLKNHSAGSGCELANIRRPDQVEGIHRDYLEAGCEAIKTNTFSANRVIYMKDDAAVEKIIREGYRIACRAAKPYGAMVFADIGTVSGLNPKETAAEYRFIAKNFLEAGAEYFLFETNASGEGLAEAAEYIRSRREDAYIIASFAVQPDGYSRDGGYAADLIREVHESGLFDAAGFNCICGARHMLELEKKLTGQGVFDDISVSMMPNAGYPVVIHNRTFYDSDPVYFASLVSRMAEDGVSFLGGCCGTTPDHIREIRKALDKRTSIKKEHKRQQKEVRRDDVRENRFIEKLKSREKAVAVELDPPEDVMTDRFMTGAGALKEAGADIITIADCPVGRARMDSSILACRIENELNMDALPHLTCRDRNINATKALLLGLYAEGVRNVLLVTGDPVPTAERDEVKIVYQFNSRKLAGYVRSVGKNELPSPFHIFGALNVNANNFDSQIGLAKKKQEKGMEGFLTQPVLSDEAVENLIRAREELDAYLLGGLFPVVSERNARFLNNEIAGIRVDDSIIHKYEGLERNEAEQLAFDVTLEFARRISSYVDGFYIVTPFQRTELVSRIIREVRRL